MVHNAPDTKLNQGMSPTQMGGGMVWSVTTSEVVRQTKEQVGLIDVNIVAAVMTQSPDRDNRSNKRRENELGPGGPKSHLWDYVDVGEHRFLFCHRAFWTFFGFLTGNFSFASKEKKTITLKISGHLCTKQMSMEMSCPDVRMSGTPVPPSPPVQFPSYNCKNR